MGAGKRPRLPAVLTANALLGGEVVYLGADGWTQRLAEAALALDEPGALELERALEAAEATGAVVEPELVPVTIDSAGRVFPSHYRDRIRALGPTVRTDLGPQAHGEHRHVSV
jgi:hypothetical protein